jgi:predicted nucleotidyltransferase component of viral defense system
MSNTMRFKAKIRNLAVKNHVPAQAVLQSYMLERLLERISLSKYKKMIVLKGGMLVASMVGISNRTTMDMDTTLRGYPLTEENIRSVFLEICATPINDAVSFLLDHITPIREGDIYGGFRVAVIASYETVSTPLKIDVTTGDVITPEAIWYAFPSDFENRSIEILAYNVETILAEKVETILRRSVLNTRPRDFYDVYVLMKTSGLVIDKKTFHQALQATAKKRMSSGILQDKEKILQTIQNDVSMQRQWNRYSKEYYYANGIEFDEAIESLISLISEE